MIAGDIILIISGSLLMLLGLLGSIIPFLPGITLSYAGILLLHFTSASPFTREFLLYWLIVVLVIHILDIILPWISAKKFGGSRYGFMGGRVGLFSGLFYPPIGIVLGPLLGGIISELVNGKDAVNSIRSGFGALLGFMIAAILKVSVACILLFYFIKALIGIL